MINTIIARTRKIHNNAMATGFLWPESKTIRNEVRQRGLSKWAERMAFLNLFEDGGSNNIRVVSRRPSVVGKSRMVRAFEAYADPVPEVTN